MEFEYQTSGRPYTLQPYQYQSTFVPADLGIIQRGLEGRQQRYDAANAAWSETKSKLYDDPTYDINAKNQVVKAIEGDFENIYKEYNGDLGAATGDLMQMIGSHRKNDYFRINKYALEKQKQYDALKQAYGAKGLEFKGMEKGLVNPQTGKLRDTSEFDFDVVQDLERDARLAAIIEQSLEDVSRESGKSTDANGKLVSKTTFGKGLYQTGGKGNVDKREGIKREFLKTAEGQLQMRIFKELNNMTDAEADKAMTDYVNDAIANRVAPPSYKYDYDNPIKETSGGNGNINNIIAAASIPIDETAFDDPLASHTTKEEKKVALNSKLIGPQSDLDQIIKDQLSVRGEQIMKNPIMRKEFNDISSQLRALGYDPTDLNNMGYFGLMPDTDETMGELRTRMFGTKDNSNIYTTSWVTGRPVPYGKKLTKAEASKVLALKQRIEKYNDMYADQVSGGVDASVGDSKLIYRGFDTGGANGRIQLTEEDKDILTKQQKRLVEYSENNLAPSSFTYTSGRWADKEEKDLEKDEDYKTLKVYPMGRAYDPWSGGLRLKLRDSKGNVYFGYPKQQSVGTTIANYYLDEEAAIAEKYKHINFLDGSRKYTVNSGRTQVTKELPKGITTKYVIGEDGSRYVNIDSDGKETTIGNLYNKYLESGDLVSAKNLLLVQSMYYKGSNIDVNSLLDQPVRYGNKEELIEAINKK